MSDEDNASGGVKRRPKLDSPPTPTPSLLLPHKLRNISWRPLKEFQINFKKNLREKKWNWFRYRKFTLRLRVKPCNLNLIQLEILSVQLYILGHWTQRQNLEIILVIHFMTRPARRLGFKFNRNGSRKRWRLIKRIDSTLKNPFKVKRIQLFHFKLHKMLCFNLTNAWKGQVTIVDSLTFKLTETFGIMTDFIPTTGTKLQHIN